MNKKYIITFIVTILILSAGTLVYRIVTKEDKPNYTTTMPNYMEEIKTIEDFEQILNSREEVYVYMGRATCGDSRKFEVYFEEMITEYNLEGKLVFFNIIDIVENDNDYKTTLGSMFDIKYTPTLAKYVNGELVLKSEWTPTYDYSKEMAEEFLKESGLID